MIYFLLLPFIYIPIKLILCLIISKFGKISYDGFSALGFSYDAPKDLFYTSRNAWQKRFGYCHLYDVWAPIFRMIIDTEPVCFYYDNKNWMITFWKGQYGMTTGGEVGIYNTKQKIINKNTLYLPASDNDMLDIDIKLYKNNELIAYDNKKHWWLAVFKMGMFSKPKQLKMDVEITFKDKNMLNAFVKSFMKLGYKSRDYSVNDNTFLFTFKKPHTHKVWTRSFVLDGIRQHQNKKNVMLYDRYLADFIDDNNSGGKKILVQNFVPNILKNDNLDLFLKEHFDLQNNLPVELSSLQNENNSKNEILLLPYTEKDKVIDELNTIIEKKDERDIYLNKVVYPGKDIYHER